MSLTDSVRKLREHLSGMWYFGIANPIWPKVNTVEAEAADLEADRDAALAQVERVRALRRYTVPMCRLDSPLEGKAMILADELEAALREVKADA